MTTAQVISEPETLELHTGGLEFEGSLIDNAKGKLRYKTVDGKKYLVADAVLLTPEVHAGSEGPILYTAESNVANASDWNDCPIVVNHPMKDGKYVTVKDNPDVLLTSSIGMVKNAQGTKNGRLKSELWFDEEATKKVDSRIYNSLVDGKPIELSTGLLLQREKAPEGSVWNGEHYTEIARKGIPDHVAILPDGEGACSIKKGCGVLVNELTDKSPIEEKKSVWRRIGEYLGILTPVPVTNEAIRHSELRAELSRQIRERFEKGPMGATLASYVYTYIEDVFDHRVVFSLESSSSSELLQLSYEKNNKTGAITLGSEAPVKVRKVVTYKPVDSIVGNASEGVVGNESEEKKMDRDAIINELVANCDCWKHHGDREVLANFSDDKLKKLKEQFDKQKNLEAVANAAKQGFESQQEGIKYVYNEQTKKFEGTPVKKPDQVPAPVANAVTTDQKARLTPEEQEDLAFARNQKNQMRSDIINRLVANAKEENRASVAQFLQGQSLDNLRQMELALPAAAPVQSSNDIYDMTVCPVQVANFLGASGGPPPASGTVDTEPPYSPPVMNFQMEKGADGVPRTTISW